MNNRQIDTLKKFEAGTLYNRDDLEKYGKSIFAFFHRGRMPVGATITGPCKEVFYLNLKGVGIIKK